MFHIPSMLDVNMIRFPCLRCNQVMSNSAHTDVFLYKNFQQTTVNYTYRIDPAQGMHGCWAAISPRLNFKIYRSM